MSYIISVFAALFGNILNGLFSWTNSYALAVFLLVLIVKVFMLPVKIGLAEIKNRPATKLKDGKPAPDVKMIVLKGAKFVISVFQFFILIGLYGCITSPITSILDVDSETVLALKDVLIENGVSRVNELSILENLAAYKDQFLSVISLEQFTIFEEFKAHFTLGPIDLTQRPSIDNLSILFPVVSTVLTIFPFILQLRGVKGATKIPLGFKLYFFFILALSCFFPYILPAGVGYYFCLSKIFGLIETRILNIIKKKRAPAQVSQKDVESFIEEVMGESKEEAKEETTEDTEESVDVANE